MKWCTIIMLINDYCTLLHETMNHPQIMEAVHKTVKCKTTCCHSFDTVVNCFIILGLLQTRTTKVVLEAQGNMFSAVCASSIYSLKVVFIFEVVFILRSSSF